MQKQLIKLANHLDRIGLAKEADYLDNIIKAASGSSLADITTEIYSKFSSLAEKGYAKELNAEEGSFQIMGKKMWPTKEELDRPVTLQDAYNDWFEVSIRATGEKQYHK
tara:strand:- start:181 stop:507 length:327 start_codon:yes stop_codon:yes gene_type:complete